MHLGCVHKTYFLDFTSARGVREAVSEAADRLNTAPSEGEAALAFQRVARGWAARKAVKAAKAAKEQDEL